MNTTPVHALKCKEFDPDAKFRRFKVIEFPLTIVGLYKTEILDLGLSLKCSAYFKTLYNEKLMKFDDAREISAAHRAFEIKLFNDHTIQIKFHPTTECISKHRKKKTQDNCFVLELHLIKVDDNRCCNTEQHAEVGRFYISGLYEYCSISHTPKILNFDDVVMFSSKKQFVLLRNESKVITIRMDYVKCTGFDVSPNTFIIGPDSFKQIAISINPTALKLAEHLNFKVMNVEEYGVDRSRKTLHTGDNFLNYIINIKVNVKCNKKPREIIIESLHKINVRSPLNTYLGEELKIFQKRKKIAVKMLTEAKCLRKAKAIEKPLKGKDQCYLDPKLKILKMPGRYSCNIIEPRITTFDLLKVYIIPFVLDFGEVVTNSFGKFTMLLKNNSSFDVTIRLLKDPYIRYTDEKKSELNVKLKLNSQSSVSVLYRGCVAGDFEGSFKLSIDNKFFLKHRYKVNINVPRLTIPDVNLKLGMVASDNFILSVPCKIYNNFNVPVDFNWSEIPQDVPFQIVPLYGTVPKRSCKICDVLYKCISTKNKVHELDLICKNSQPEALPITLNLITRKLTVKFLQQSVNFKPIPINLVCTEDVKLENTSRESVVFHVLEPLIPGVTVEPMEGVLQPKSILNIQVVVKINYVLEFAFEICFKINNKENLLLSVYGNVIDPDIIITPKTICEPRIPSNVITYVPLNIQNTSPVTAVIEVDDNDNENIFGIYIPQGNEKQRVYEFAVEAYQTRIVYIKVYDVFRREYDMYIPFKINGLLGPPNLLDGASLKFNYYAGQYFANYENNPKVKICTVSKDICTCRITGVITIPWVSLSVEKFEIDYIPGGSNSIHFFMTNVSKYNLTVTISTAKLMPFFTLTVVESDIDATISETLIKFDLDRDTQVKLVVKFHPKNYGRFVCSAPFFLDKYLSVPYYNLTFVGKRQIPVMTLEPERIIFVPCGVKVNLSQTVTIKLDDESDLDSFSYTAIEEPNLSIKFIGCEEKLVNEMTYTFVTVEVSVYCENPASRCLHIYFNHIGGSSCDIELSFCCTYCPLTLHVQQIVSNDNNPFPYYPNDTQSDIYHYLEKCTTFLEKWMYQHGFRRDIYPAIPETFHIISSALCSTAQKRAKGINVSLINFLKRIASPFMKHVKKSVTLDSDEPYKSVKEIHDTYKDLINLLRARGVNLWTIRPIFLLSFKQFEIYVEETSTKSYSEKNLIKQLLGDRLLFDRLSKQSWLDFILQCYKAFILDSCLFECVCISSSPRNIVQIMVNWYNENMKSSHKLLRKMNKPLKVIENLTTDLSDGIAIILSFVLFCPFLKDHFALFLEIEENDKEGIIIHNACLIIEALNILKIYFPLTSNDFIQPNFLQMLFFSVHLFVTLPMMAVKDRIIFSPPLLKTSSRLLSIIPTTHEFVQFTHIILNNNSRNNFIVEKSAEGDCDKKMSLNIRYTANFIEDCEYLLLIHGYNKTRIFDTYIVFKLIGRVSSVIPVRKCKVVGPLYRPVRVDAPVCNPFTTFATFKLFQTDIEPKVPIEIEENHKSFYVRRLSLLETEITLPPTQKDSTKTPLVKIHFELICLSTQIGSTWIWCRSDVGEFCFKILTQPRCELALDVLRLNVKTWPVDPCSCGESCECYRTYEITIPHRNEMMVKALRSALLANATELMMDIFDVLLETKMGKKVITMLLAQSGTIMSEVSHILLEQIKYRISSPNLFPQLSEVTFYQYTDAVFTLPITVPPLKSTEKYSVVFTSECGNDIRTYNVLFVVEESSSSKT